MDTKYYDFFHKVQKQYRHYCLVSLKEYGLSSYEIDVLAFLINNPNLDRASDIVYIKGISKGLVAKAVKSLHRKAYIDIKMDDKDHRCFHLSLNENCEDIVKIIKTCTSKFIGDIQAGITNEEMMIIKNSFIKMNENLDEFERRNK